MIFGKDLSILKKIMDYRIFRQGVVSSNIANLDTPGYKAKDVNFKETQNSIMQDSGISMKRTDPHHLKTASSRPGYNMLDDPYSRIGNDANTVDIDREMMKLTENHVLYNAAAQIVQQKLEWIKNTIRGIN